MLKISKRRLKWYITNSLCASGGGKRETQDRVK